MWEFPRGGAVGASVVSIATETWNFQNDVYLTFTIPVSALYVWATCQYRQLLDDIIWCHCDITVTSL